MANDGEELRLPDEAPAAIPETTPAPATPPALPSGEALPRLTVTPTEDTAEKGPSLRGRDSTPSKPAPAENKPLDNDDEELGFDDDDDDDDEPLAIPGDDTPTRKHETAAPLPQTTKAKESAKHSSEPLESLPVPAPNTAAGNARGTASDKPAPLPKAKPAQELPIEKLAEKPAEKPFEHSRGSEKHVSPGLLKGFKGFCPVILKDERRLVEARSQFRAEHHGKIYTFSSAEAKAAFDENPVKYVPVKDGRDVVRLAGGGDEVEGSLEHAAWYRGRLYLFTSDETRREFVEKPSRFMTNE